ncbi:ATP-dependent DNA helicase [Flagellatimonas centrodinii]|uniref:ATP-dependent DNA helicase n=1 Tax=Flagellatimonas centrodinii TaxID=2806210 RepID=UPI001FED6EE6|nr:ATP-dependent DNA helicase [Flagellatimonas centrodinii]ULQ45787.1 ATP-dependent DNA helicase [Flagellatimonas centrodinii]
MSQAAEWLGPDGVLAARLPGFSPRPAQLAMAEAVAQAFSNASTVMIEAGTGTGKTYAYLAPALASGQRVLVSTGTKNLQDQLYRRDLPRLVEALGVPVRTALLKGRANYLCLHRMKRARDNPAARTHWRALDEVARWSRQTADGDLADLGARGDDDALARQITSTAENCLGSRCEDYNDCFVVKARRQAQGAELLVVNHHLLFADYVLKQEGFGQLLSGVDAVVIDEAHQLPALAAQFFGQRLSTRQLRDLARDIASETDTLGDLPDLRQAADRLEAACAPLEACFVRMNQRATLTQFLALPGVTEALAALRQELSGLLAQLAPVEERNAELAAAVARALDVSERMDAILDGRGEAQVRWVEPLARGGSLNATPIVVADGFRKMLETYPGAWVLTSATLAAGGRFDHFAGQLGLDPDTGLALESPFDFMQQARLWLPEGLPDPGQAHHPQAVAEACLPLLEASNGGIFFLCTSRRALSQIAAWLRPRLRHTLLVQGEADRAQLLQQFADDGNAVLVGTSSFWEGVDVRGRALRVVVIDKLPFAAPGDPVFDARLQALRAQGRNPFNDHQLPEAIMTLRQGVGRLIRDVEDRGLLVLCDPRLRSKPYGRRVLASLPAMPQLDGVEAALEWVATL